MPWRIAVTFRPAYRDALGETTRKSIVEDLGIAVKTVRTLQVYTIDAPLSPDEAERVRKELFTDPIVQTSFVQTLEEPNILDQIVTLFGFSQHLWSLEIGFRPGVTDTVGKTARTAIETVLQRRLPENAEVYTSIQYLLEGELSYTLVERIARDLLANPLIQRWEIYSFADWQAGKWRFLPLPRVAIDTQIAVREYDLDLPPTELLRLSREGLLALSLEEMLAIRDYYAQPERQRERAQLGLGKFPTDVELEALAQTWSEHCKHKIFHSLITYEDDRGEVQEINSLFHTFIRRATEEIGQRVDWLVSVFHDNAGVIKFNEQWNLVMKVETHNTPSALDPYGGAITGIVGVNRDPFGTGKGCRLIFNTDVLCFAPPDYAKPLPPKLLHPKRILKGVHRGIKDGANQSGIPDVNGAILFDERFLGKPLVFCGTGGLMPAQIRGEPAHLKRTDPGDWIVMVGGRIGKDGIHGATFSSLELSEDSPATAVQIGDPITQKKMFDFLLEARDRGYYKCITDNGAGGLSSSVGEMARFSNGCEIHLEKAPLKYAGLQPWEILLSEAQERMTLAVAPESLEAFLRLAAERDVEATPLGTFTNTGKFHVLYQGKTVAYLDMDFLHNGLPRMHLQAKWIPPQHPEPHFPEPEDCTPLLLRLLSSLNVCSKESLVRQYDHEVQGMSAIKPFVGAQNDGPSDAAVLRPFFDSYEGIIVANGICPRYSDIDTYHMVGCAIDEAVRNVLAVGGKLGYIAGLDNFCWPDPIQSEKTPDGRYKLAQLVRANQALYDYCTAYDLPCISGKDSMKNDYHIGDQKISVPPTVLFSVIARLEDVRRAVTMDAKRVGDLVYVLGETRAELGGSEYYALQGFIGNSVPKVDARQAKRLYQALAQATEQGLVASCHDCSEGGLGVALAETAFAGGLGMNVTLEMVPRTADVVRDDIVLFSESPSRFVVTVHPERQDEFERVMAGLPYGYMGTVTEEPRFFIRGLRGTGIIQSDIGTLKAAWQQPLMNV